jgi:Carboxypeptidase regulatory-like domain
MRLLWVGILAAAIQVPQNQAGSIEGTVTTSGAAHAPLAGAQITLSQSSDQFGGRLFLSEATSDSGGHFSFQEVPPGQYVLEARRDGYGYRTSVKALSPVSTVNVTVSPGMRVQASTIQLSAAGTIRGRVLDRNDKGVAHVRVEFLRLTDDEDGRKMWRPWADPVLTDVEGNYERTMLVPGDYYLRTILEVGPLRMPVYYPETTESGAAAPIAVYEGGEIAGDIRTGSAVPPETYSVSGNVIRPTSEAGKSAFVELVLMRNNPGGPVEESGRFLAAASQVLVKRNDEGTRASGGQPFEFRSVPSGRYDLLANAIIDGEEYSSRVSVYAGDGVADKAELVLHPSVEVKGTIVVEGELRDLPAQKPDPGAWRGDIKLQLNRKDGLPLGVSGPGDLRIDSDGRSFSIRDVPEGDYELQVSIERQPGNDHYIADIRADGKSVFDTGFRVGLDPVDSLEVLVGTQGGSIQGRIIGSQSPLPGALVLVPELFRRNNVSLYRVVYLPGNAEFKMNGIAPGNYKLFAVPYLDETVPYRSPEFVARHESRAVSVTVQKGTTVEGIQVPFLSLGR